MCLLSLPVFTFILFDSSLHSVVFMLKNTGNECACQTSQILSISNMLFNSEIPLNHIMTRTILQGINVQFAPIWTI